MNKKMIFLDLDGTLLDDEKKLPQVNREAMDEALAAGHKVLICTGRPLSSAVKLLPFFGLDKPGCYAITYNGGLIYDAGEKKAVYIIPEKNESNEYRILIPDADIKAYKIDYKKKEKEPNWLFFIFIISSENYSFTNFAPTY